MITLTLVTGEIVFVNPSQVRLVRASGILAENMAEVVLAGLTMTVAGTPAEIAAKFEDLVPLTAGGLALHIHKAHAVAVRTPQGSTGSDTECLVLVGGEWMTVDGCAGDVAEELG